MARSIIPLRHQSKDIPLVGKIVAGTPVESAETIEEKIDLGFLGINNSGNDYFAVRVNGSSMINAHIMDGDIVVIKKQARVYETDVAAVLWNGEATSGN